MERRIPPRPGDVVVGIDTGGTYTDAVLLDMASREVIASAKSPTTPDDLARGVTRALSRLSIGDPARVRLVGVSSTLATNSIAEGRIRPVGLLLLGYDRELVERYHLDAQLERAREVAYLAGGHTSQGREREPLDAEGIRGWVARHAADLDGIAISGYFSPLDPGHELRALEIVRERCDLPVVLGHQLSTRLGSVKRAGTACLNASLVAVMGEFIGAVRRVLRHQEIDAPLMVVKGDGSLMPYGQAIDRPVETVLSGPAASASGGRFLTSLERALVLDVGGTTTDIALVEDGRTALDDDGVMVGEIETAVRAGKVRTLCVGCDSLITVEHGGLQIGPERAIPLSRLAADCPQVAQDLEALSQRGARRSPPSDLEYWVLRRVPSAGQHNERLIQLLRDGPRCLTRILETLEVHHPVQLDVDGLVRDRVLERAALTPTDLLHGVGGSSTLEGVPGSAEGARHAVECFCTVHGLEPAGFVERALDEVVVRMVEAAVVFLASRRGRPLPQRIPDDGWGRWFFEQVLRGDDPLLSVALETALPVVGVGAPAGFFVRQVAQRLGGRFVLPASGAVANAVGAVAGSVVVRREAVVYRRDVEGTVGHVVHLDGECRRFDEAAPARSFAEEAAARLAEAGARAAGAVDPEVEVRRIEEGALLRVEARATGSPRLSQRIRPQRSRRMSGTGRCRLTVLGRRERTVELLPDESVRDALSRCGLAVEAPCNGTGTCGRCRVEVDGGGADIPATPHASISARDHARGVRLACQLTPTRDLAIRLCPGTSLAPAEPAVAAAVGSGGEGRLGLAVDLGTTTLVGSLCSLEPRQVLATEAVLNPQTRFGHDVLTRVQHGSSPEGLGQLAGAVHRGLALLVELLCDAASLSPRAVTEVVVGGNTTMLQLAAAIDPAPLGQAPFQVGIESGWYPASRFGLEVHPEARLYVPPVLHAFAGSDLSAGLSCCPGFFDGDGGTVLFMDVGTNGELGLSSGGRRVTTSAAAGPAFEGMGLSCGMLAHPGAVEAVTTDGVRLSLSTVEGAPVAGLCGSGAVDLLACLLRVGLLDPTGRIRTPEDGDPVPSAVAGLLDTVDGMPAVRLCPGVFLTQEDVRQLQLAKAALRTAIDMLLEAFKAAPEAAPAGQHGGRSAGGAASVKVDRLVLAGGFGQRLRPASLEAIGMIPPGLGRRLEQAGNTSRRGCLELLGDPDARERLERLMAGVQHLMLADTPDYMERFIGNIELPPPRRRPRSDGVARVQPGARP